MLQSRIAWIDHDAEARERSMRVLAMFGERDTRDELGLGAIRDNLSELLVPGTSTIQTRLRDMLLVAWVYRQVESGLAQGEPGPRGSAAVARAAIWGRAGARRSGPPGAGTAGSGSTAA